MPGTKITMRLAFAAAMLAPTSFASASDLDNLKVQTEALNARMAQMETAPSVPAGFQLMTVSQQDAIIVPSLDAAYDSKYYGKNASTIGIIPTADSPVGTDVQWSGFARAALVYWNGDVDRTSAAVPRDKSTEIYARGEAKVVGTTETAVGEVGARIIFRADFEGFRNMGFGNANNGGGNKGDVLMPEAWGWWKLTPDLTLGGGFIGTLAKVNSGIDGSCTCFVTNTAPVRLNPGDRTQLRLFYKQDALSLSVALEDGSFNDPELGKGLSADTIGVSAEGILKLDGMSFEVSGGWWDGGSNRRDAYQIGLGAKFDVNEMIALSAAVGMGRNASLTSSPSSDFIRSSLLATIKMTDTFSAELGYGYAENDQSSFSSFAYSGTAGAHFNAKVHSIIGGLYYTPVSQLTLGFEGEWQKWNSDADAAGTVNKDLELYSIGLVSVYRL